MLQSLLFWVHEWESFFLQTLLKSQARPFTALGFHFLFNFPQGARVRWLWFHPFPFLVVVTSGRMRKRSHPNYGGSVKMHPNEVERQGMTCQILPSIRDWPE